VRNVNHKQKQNEEKSKGKVWREGEEKNRKRNAGKNVTDVSASGM